MKKIRPSQRRAGGIVLMMLAAAMLAPVIAVSSAETGQNQAGAKDSRRSGFEFMGASTQAMQLNEAFNPGMLWVKDGEALWGRAMGKSQLSCASCHGDAGMRGVAARYPAFDEELKRPIGLSQRIKLCHVNRQQAEPWRPENQELLSLEAYLAYQSRGLPVAPAADARLKPFIASGLQRFRQRIGQLDLSCAQCHEERAGQRLGSSLIPQAHPTGYPVYRLEWQGLGSLQRRLRGCMNGVRAEPFAYDSQELAELELYLAVRARGMSMEGVGVRP
ncbi:MAG: sulfur oxidation c-type cytochrome SoxA [Pseudomonadota bacterium]